MSHQSITIDGCNPSNWDSPDVFDHMIQGQVAAANATIAIWEGFEDTVDATAKWHRSFRQDQDKVIHVRERTLTRNFCPGGYEADLREYLDGVERLIEVAGIEHVGTATDSCEGHDRDFWRRCGRSVARTEPRSGPLKL